MIEDIYVIIPTHNSESTLPDAIRSINRASEQSKVAFHVIVIDDNSDNDIESFVYNLSPEAKFIRSEYSGVSAARNAGLGYIYLNNIGDQLKNAWVTFLDSDDMLYPDFFDMNWSVDEETNFIVFDYVNSLEEVALISPKKTGNVLDVSSDWAIESSIAGVNGRYNFNSPWSRLINLDWLHRAKLQFNDQLSYKEDFLFNITALSKKDVHIKHVAKVGYVHIRNPYSVINNFVESALKDELLIQNSLKSLSLSNRILKLENLRGWVSLLYIYVFPKNVSLSHSESAEFRNRYKQSVELLNEVKFSDLRMVKNLREFMLILLALTNSYVLIYLIFKFRR
ncbi:glycosyltransferase family A protein [Weissella confusa]|uniref:glycosyltransferase family A protein n=1 Tax=Weissella confusa TaxID=1583 RepID=UPI0022E96A92|nr:glycosyltransferase family A protein [Weissella confusa]